MRPTFDRMFYCYCKVPAMSWQEKKRCGRRQTLNLEPLIVEIYKRYHGCHGCSRSCSPDSAYIAYINSTPEGEVPFAEVYQFLRMSLCISLNRERNTRHGRMEMSGQRDGNLTPREQFVVTAFISLATSQDPYALSSSPQLKGSTGPYRSGLEPE